MIFSKFVNGAVYVSVILLILFVSLLLLVGYVIESIIPIYKRAVNSINKNIVFILNIIEEKSCTKSGNSQL